MKLAATIVNTLALVMGTIFGKRRSKTTVVPEDPDDTDQQDPISILQQRLLGLGPMDPYITGDRGGTYHGTGAGLVLDSPCDDPAMVRRGAVRSCFLSWVSCNRRPNNTKYTRQEQARYSKRKIPKIFGTGLLAWWIDSTTPHPACFCRTT
jgi:hypothetical protein